MDVERQLCGRAVCRRLFFLFFFLGYKLKLFWVCISFMFKLLRAALLFEVHVLPVRICLHEKYESLQLAFLPPHSLSYYLQGPPDYYMLIVDRRQQ